MKQIIQSKNVKMKFDCARVSKNEQNFEIQIEKLKKLKLLIKSREFSVTEIYKMIEIGRSVFYRAVAVLGLFSFLWSIIRPAI